MFRERPTRRSPLFAAGTLALLLSSCAELQTIREDVCGNGVVENDEVAHESCDGQDNCGAPGTTHACRFVCDPATKDCPAGYGCGIDGECRMPSGKFEELSSFSTPTAIDLFVNDINADGCSEVFHTTLRGTTMTAFESHVAFGCTAAKQDISSTAPLGPGESLPPAPVLADASRDGLQDLLVPGRGRFGGGLFANLGTSGPGLAPLLYPSVKVQENTVKPLRVTYHGDDALLLFLGDLEDSPDEQGCMGGMGGAGGTGMGGMGMGGMGGGPPGGGGMGGGPPPGGGLGVAAVRSAEKKPVGIGGLPGTLATLAFAQAANLDSDPSCDEVAVGIAGEPRIHLLSICGANDIQLKELGALDLDSGAQIRSTNASLAIVDFDGDGHLDLVVDATDAKIHVGYGDGTGKFHSVPGSIDPADHTTAAVNPPSPEFADPHRFFVAGDFDASKAGAELVSLPCPDAMPFSSPVCAATSGRCEAIVTDIDGDGDLDILSTSNQEPGITVQRGLGGGQFHETFLDTTCPPHDLVGGDLDGDGVNDLAFFDQTSTFDAVTRQAKGQTTLAIAYGKGYAAPEAAVLSGRFDLATGLAIGKFAGGDDQLLYATRRILCEPLGAGAALVEGQSARLPVAPFYYPAGPMGSDNLLGMELVSATVGRYFPIEKQDSEFGLAVVTRTLKTTSDKEGTTGTEKLWLLAGHANATSVLPLTHAATTVPECTACVLAAVDVDELNTGSQGAESTATAGESATDEMLLLGDGEAIVYQVSKDANGQAAGFEVRASFKPKHSFAFTNPDPLANPKKYVPRPIVKDLDGDRYNDVIVRANDGALVAFWGKADGTFDETELMTPKAKCPEGEVCKGYSAALLNVDRDGASEVFIIGPDTMGLYDVIAASRTLAPIAPGGDASIFHPPPPDSDFTVAAPGDFDGDGVDDVVFLASSSFVTVLRGIPGLQ